MVRGEQLVASPAELHFASVVPGSAPTLDVRIDSGSSDVTLPAGIILTGDDASDFSIVAGDASAGTIPAASSRTITVQLLADALLGVLRCSLSAVASNASLSVSVPVSAVHVNETKLSRPTALTNHFGWDLALSADAQELLATAYRYDNDLTHFEGGSAYLFESGSASPVFEFVPSDSVTFRNAFGVAAAIAPTSSRVVAVSADQRDDRRGSVYVYTRSARSNQDWSNGTLLVPSSIPSDSFFGHKVDLDATGLSVVASAISMAVGETSSAGVIYVFTRVSLESDVWTESELVAANPVASGQLGRGLAISGNGLVVLAGAPSPTSTAGVAIAFSRTSLSNTTWTKTVVSPSSGSIGDRFGWACDLSFDGMIAVVAAPTAPLGGVVYVFSNDGSWSQIQELQPSGLDGDDRFGNSLSISGDGETLVVGTFNEPSTATVTGKAYLFLKPDETQPFYQAALLLASDAPTGSRFGRQVALSPGGSSFAIGAVQSGGTPSNAYWYRSSSFGIEPPTVAPSDALNFGGVPDNLWSEPQAIVITASTAAVSDLAFGIDGGDFARFRFVSGNETVSLALGQNHSVVIQARRGTGSSDAHMAFFVVTAPLLQPIFVTLVSCASGQYANGSACAVCPAGTAGGGPTEAQCTACGAGRFSLAGSAGCLECSPGRFSSALAATSNATCVQCGPGRYSPQSAASSAAACLACEAGRYSSVAGANSNETCAPCSAGRFSSVPAAINDSSCTPCAAGRYCSVPGSNGTAGSCGSDSSAALQGEDCAPCPPGTFVREQGATLCAPCPPATFCSLATVTPTTCADRVAEACPARASAPAACPSAPLAPRAGWADTNCTTQAFTFTSGSLVLGSSLASSMPTATAPAQLFLPAEGANVSLAVWAEDVLVGADTLQVALWSAAGNEIGTCSEVAVHRSAGEPWSLEAVSTLSCAATTASSAVTIAFKRSSAEEWTPTNETLRFPPPVATRFCPDGSACLTSGNITVTEFGEYRFSVEGFNFSTNSVVRFPSLSSSETSRVSEASCSFVSTQLLQCLLATAPNGLRRALVESDDQLSYFDVLIQFPSRPEVTTIRGCVRDVGDATLDCSTAGGERLTVSGELGSTDEVPEVFVGSSKCENVTRSGTTLSCDLPPGAGVHQLVIVYARVGDSPFAAGSEPVPLVSYAAPAIDGLYADECEADLVSGVALSECPREGGFFLTIAGRNFGCDAPRALVGGQSCLNVQALESGACPFDRGIRCLAPSGFERNRVVTVLQAGGEVSPQTDVLLSYARCPVGLRETGTTACVQCQAGTFGAFEGVENCASCEAGRFQDTPGASECEECGEGTISGPRAVSCQKCPAGSFSASRGSTRCVPCDAGLISTLDRQSCVACKAGKFSSRNSSSCTPCEAGTSSASEAAQCTACPAGTASGPAAPNCTLCLAGRFSAGGASICEACASGSVSGLGAALCLPCPAGTVADATSSSCAPCPANTFSEGNTTDCTPCESGYVSLPRSSQCQRCAAGFRANAAGSACVECPPGRFSERNATVCVECVPGRFTGQSASPQCRLCPAGRASGAEAAECDECDPGRFSEGETASCTVCAAGTVSTAGSALCLPCPAGSVANLTTSNCTLCPAGRFSVGGASECLRCRAGTISAGGAERCSDCAVGRYASGIAWTSCLVCEAGTFAIDAGSNSTSLGAASGAVACRPCAPGFFSERESRSCLLCGRGTASNTSGTGDQCEECPLGSFAANARGQPAAQGAVLCVPCEPGHFSPVRGATSCLACDPGTRTPGAGASTCTECPVNFRASQNNCTRCPSGSFTTGPGAIECSSCSGNRYMRQDADSELQCEQCPPNADCTENIEAAPGFYLVAPARGPQGQVIGAPSIQSCRPAGACLRSGVCTPSRVPNSGGVGNPLCAECLPDHVEIGRAECEPCDSVNVPAVLGGVAIFMVLLGVFEVTSRSASATNVPLMLLFFVGQSYSVALDFEELDAFQLDGASYTCLWPHSPVDFVMRGVIQSAFMFVCVIAVWVGNLVRKCICGGKLRSSSSWRVVSVLLQRLFVMVVRSTAAIGNCVELAGEQRVSSVPSVRCSDGAVATWRAVGLISTFAIVMFFVLVLLLPELGKSQDSCNWCTVGAGFCDEFSAVKKPEKWHNRFGWMSALFSGGADDTAPITRASLRGRFWLMLIFAMRAALVISAEYFQSKINKLACIMLLECAFACIWSAFVPLREASSSSWRVNNMAMVGSSLCIVIAALFQILGGDWSFAATGVMALNMAGLGANLVAAAVIRFCNPSKADNNVVVGDHNKKAKGEESCLTLFKVVEFLAGLYCWCHYASRPGETKIKTRQGRSLSDPSARSSSEVPMVSTSARCPASNSGREEA